MEKGIAKGIEKGVEKYRTGERAESGRHQASVAETKAVNTIKEAC